MTNGEKNKLLDLMGEERNSYKVKQNKEMEDLVDSFGLHTLTDENYKKVAEWYITDQAKGVVVCFTTLEPSKCKKILNIVLETLGIESETNE